MYKEYIIDVIQLRIYFTSKYFLYALKEDIQYGYYS